MCSILYYDNHLVVKVRVAGLDTVFHHSFTKNHKICNFFLSIWKQPCPPYALKLLLTAPLSPNSQRQSCPQLIRMQKVDNLLRLVIPGKFRWQVICQHFLGVKVQHCPPTCLTQVSLSGPVVQLLQAHHLPLLPSSNPRQEFCFRLKPRPHYYWLVFGFRLATRRRRATAASAEQRCSCLLYNPRRLLHSMVLGLALLLLSSCDTGLQDNPLKPVVTACTDLLLHGSYTLNPIPAWSKKILSWQFPQLVYVYLSSL